MFKLKYLMFVLMAFCACRKEKFQLPPLITHCIPKEAIVDSITSITVYFPGMDVDGRAVAIKTNKRWEASAKIIKPVLTDSTFLALVFETYSSRSFRKEEVDFRPIPLKKGCYALKSWNSNVKGISGSYFRLDEDVLLNSYDVDTISMGSNRLEITEVDSTTHIVRGLFSVTFKIFGRKLWPEDPDSVRFFNGFFEAKIE